MAPQCRRLKLAVKKVGKQIPRGLKAARNDKNNDLYGTAEAVPFQNKSKTELFGQRVKLCRFQSGFEV
jgi:hypothetical protein